MFATAIAPTTNAAAAIQHTTCVHTASARLTGRFREYSCGGAYGYGANCGGGNGTPVPEGGVCHCIDGGAGGCQPSDVGGGAWPHGVAGDGGGAAGTGSGTATGVPQCAQNRAPSTTAVPHCVQKPATVPHCPRPSRQR